MIPVAASLWEAWPQVAERCAAADELLLLLDYDGTLAPIAERPEQVRLAPTARRLVARLARRPDCWVAVISGRALRDVKRQVALDEVCYVGNHGLEVEGPELRYTNPVAKGSRPLLGDIARRLREVLDELPGVWLEDKTLTLTVHYRMAEPHEARVARLRASALLRPYQAKQQIWVTEGKQVLEVRPPVRWTKGTIVRWLLARRAAVHETAQVLPIYLGDDVTDEDAFDALGRQGLTVAVGPLPGTKARYAVPSPREVHRFLRKLYDVRVAHG